MKKITYSRPPHPHPQKRYFRFGFLVKKSLTLAPSSHPHHFFFNLDLDSLWKKLTYSAPFLSNPPPPRKKKSDLDSFEKKNYPSHTPTPSHPPDFFFFGYIWILYKKSLSGFFVKESFTYHNRHLSHPPTEKIIHLYIILWILVRSDTVNVLILFGGHCDLYIMIQRFCLVSLTISNRKTSYRSLKQTAGSTNCPWTTILVLPSIEKSKL